DGGGQRGLRLPAGGQQLPGAPGEALHLPPVAFSPGAAGGGRRTGIRQRRLPGYRPVLQPRGICGRGAQSRKIQRINMAEDIRFWKVLEADKRSIRMVWFKSFFKDIEEAGFFLK